MVSGTISLALQAFFSPFPHGTRSLSVTWKYLALEGGPPGFPRNSTCSAVLGKHTRESSQFRLPAYHRLWKGFPAPSATSSICNSLGVSHIPHGTSHDTVPATRARLALTRFRLFPFRSPLLGESRLIFFPRATEMFHFARSPPLELCNPKTAFIPGLQGMTPAGFPHSGIHGSKPAAAPRGLSQLTTPFFGSRCLGIPHAPFVPLNPQASR
jgi:hypothetical protein